MTQHFSSIPGLPIRRTGLTFLLDTIYNAAVWTLVEPCIGQVCGCAVIARGLFPAFKCPRAALKARLSRQDDVEEKAQTTSLVKERNSSLISSEDTMKEAILGSPKRNEAKETVAELDVV